MTAMHSLEGFIDSQDVSTKSTANVDPRAPIKAVKNRGVYKKRNISSCSSSFRDRERY